VLKSAIRTQLAGGRGRLCGQSWLFADDQHAGSSEHHPREHKSRQGGGTIISRRPLIRTPLDGGAAVRLVPSRANPGGNGSGIGLKDRNGIGVGCRVRNKMQRLKWGAGLCVGLRQAAIFVDREGTCDCDPSIQWSSKD
jgi:hypothetical protein